MSFNLLEVAFKYCDSLTLNSLSRPRLHSRLLLVRRTDQQYRFVWGVLGCTRRYRVPARPEPEGLDPKWAVWSPSCDRRRDGRTTDARPGPRPASRRPATGRLASGSPLGPILKVWVTSYNVHAVVQNLVTLTSSRTESRWHFDASFFGRLTNSY